MKKNIFPRVDREIQVSGKTAGGASRSRHGIAGLLVASLLTLTAAAALAQTGFGEPLTDTERAAMLATGAKERADAADTLAQQGEQTLAAANRDEARIEEIAKEIARFEAAIADSRKRLVKLANIEADASDTLHDRRSQHAAAFSAMVALSKAQGPAIVAHDGDATNAARAATVLEGMRAALRAQAVDTHRRMSDIRDLRVRTEAAREDAKSAIASLRERERELWTLVGNRRESGQEQIARAATLKREADHLNAQAAALNFVVRRAPAPAPKPVRTASLTSPGAIPRILPPAQPISTAQGRLAAPVMGEIVAAYDGGQGPSDARGVVFEAKPYSRVYAPWNGTVSYAGPVKSFGLVAVIDIGENHQIVLAGLASNERKKGDAVMRGEPIGHLGGPISEGDEFLSEESAQPDGATASLYFQMRRNGDPIDPVPWLE